MPISEGEEVFLKEEECVVRGILVSVESLIDNSIIFEFGEDEFHVTCENRAARVAIVFLRKCLDTTFFLPDMEEIINYNRCLAHHCCSGLRSW